MLVKGAPVTILLVYTKFGCIYYQSMNHWYIDAYEEKNFFAGVALFLLTRGGGY